MKKIIGLILLLTCVYAQASVSYSHAKLVLQKISHGMYQLRYLNIKEVNAYSESSGISITKGMLHLLQSDDQVAMILGHEMSHMAHKDYLTPSSSAKELRSDKEGYATCQKAGFTQCSSVFYLMMKVFGDTGGSVHPKWSVRIANIQGHAFAAQTTENPIIPIVGLVIVVSYIISRL